MNTDTVKNKNYIVDNKIHDSFNKKDKENFNPTIFFSSSPQVSKLTLESQGVLLYDSQK